MPVENSLSVGILAVQFLLETQLVLEGADLNFNNNSAETGASIAMYDSWMSVSNNTAFIEGGAIYAHQSADLYIPHALNCFIRFVDSEEYWISEAVYKSGFDIGTPLCHVSLLDVLP
jgi:predicted outer membrane repeat protein